MRTQREVRAACEVEADKMRRVVGMAAWYDAADRALTDNERYQVRQVWNDMSGSSCWNSAFLKWFHDLPVE